MPPLAWPRGYRQGHPNALGLAAKAAAVAHRRRELLQARADQAAGESVGNGVGPSEEGVVTLF